MAQKAFHKTIKNRYHLYNKVILIGLFLVSLSIFSYAQEGFKGIIVEKIPVTAEAVAADPTLPANAIAYRVFVDMNPGYEMQAVFGNVYNNDLILKTTTTFYNNADGATSGRQMPNFLFNDPAGRFDSYITVDGVTSTRVGILLSEDITDGTVDGYTTGTSLPLQTIGADFDSHFGDASATGITFFTDNAAYNVNGGEMGTTTSNRVLIGQFTTDGVFSFEINIQIRNPDDNTSVEQYFARQPYEYSIGSKVYHHPDLHYPGPAVQISSPANGSIFATGSSVDISASTQSNGLAYVEFFINDISIGKDMVSPYQTSWTSVAGEATIKAVAMDSLTASDTSDVVTLSVGYSSPTVAITSPAASSIFIINNNISISADASDADGTISLIEFYANDVKIGEDNTAPYQINWTPSVAGAIDLKAIATDNDALKTTSAVINITIQTGTSIHDSESADDFITIFPNPAKESITIEFSKMTSHADFLTEISDLQGNSYIKKHIYVTDGSTSATIDISSLPKGVYFIRFISEDSPIVSKKIVKN